MIIWSGIKGTKWEAYDGSLLNKPSLGEATASENMIAIWTDKVFSKWLCFVLFFLLYLNGHRQHAEHFKFLLVLFNFLCRQRVQHLQLNIEIPQRTVTPTYFSHLLFLSCPWWVCEGTVPSSSQICCLGQGFIWVLPHFIHTRFYTWPCLWQAKVNLLLAFCWAGTPLKTLITNVSAIAYSINRSQGCHYRHLHTIIWCTYLSDALLKFKWLKLHFYISHFSDILSCHRVINLRRDIQHWRLSATFLVFPWFAQYTYCYQNILSQLFDSFLHWKCSSVPAMH